MNKRKEIYQDASRERFYRILEYLSKTIDSDKAIYLVGSTYKDIKMVINKFNVEIIKIKSLRDGWLKLVPIPVSKNFVIKINNKQELVEIVKSLEDHDPIEIFIFNKNIEDKFSENFNIDNREYTRSLIEDDPEYLIYGMDFDNIESTTEALEYISYGEEISNKMKWYF